MLETGVIVNAGTRSRFDLWHRDDPALPSLEASFSHEGNDRENGKTATAEVGNATFSRFPLRSGEREREKESATAADAAPPSDDEDDFPW
jgi:hypothetical protein